jgi:hypothetical protein
MKTTCLWLRGLPQLIHAERDELFYKKTHTRKPSPKFYHKEGSKKAGQAVYFTEANPGKKARERTFPGIAKAMADQWGNLPFLERYGIITHGQETPRRQAHPV